MLHLSSKEWSDPSSPFYCKDIKMYWISSNENFIFPFSLPQYDGKKR